MGIYCCNKELQVHWKCHHSFLVVRVRTQIFRCLCEIPLSKPTSFNKGIILNRHIREFVSCYEALTCFSDEQKLSAAVQTSHQMSFRQGATTAGTCTGNCVTWRRNWVCWDLLVFQTKTNTTGPCGRCREWRVSSSTACRRQTRRVGLVTVAPVQRRASAEIPPKREACHGGLCLSDGPWWSPQAVCRGTLPWCTGWHMGKTAPSAGWSPWWCPSSRVSSLHNLWRWDHSSSVKLRL